MKILVVGGGGREHAIIKKLRENPRIGDIYALPGNGGIAADAHCVPIKANDVEGIVAFVREHPVDFAVVAPDDPLVLGCVDRLEEIGVPCFGPRANAAIIEGSKIFAKDLMRKYGIPTAACEVFDTPEAALSYLSSCPYPAVIKADGLALGKGVVIAQDYGEAEAAVRAMMCDKIFGESGRRVLVEEFLTGPEVSVLSFTDGNIVVPMVSSMDHKRAREGDEGPNTGGMGTVAPNPYYTEEIARQCMDTIFLPTIRAMKAEGRTFRGCLYFGLMLTPKGPRVIEYNCRFGDPETQVVLPLLESDLFEILSAVRDGRLSPSMVRFRRGAACCVVVASDGYPGHYETGNPITLPAAGKGEALYVAGARLEGDVLVNAGGRVVNAVAAADTLPEAVARAMELAARVQFKNAYYRRDIGKRALAVL